MIIKKFLIFCTIGVLGAGVDLLVFNILFDIKTPFVISRALAILSAITFNFFLNRDITFKAKKGLFKKQYPKHVLVYSIVLIVNVTVSTLIFFFLGDSLLNANIAAASGIIAGIPISFFGSMLWTFKK